MANNIKKENLTQEQKDFILNYFNKGRSAYNQVIDPDLAWSHFDQQVSENNDTYWIDRLKISSSGSLPFAQTQKTAVKSYIKNNYSELSEAAKVLFIKQHLSTYKNVAIQTILSSDEVAKATDVNTLCSALQTALDDKNLKKHLEENPLISGPMYQAPGTSKPTVASQFLSARAIVNVVSDVSKSFNDYPHTPKPEPIVEKPKEFETTSKDHKVRIEQWMEHVGMKDKAQELIDKYGLPVAYEIVQTSMQSPANITKATDDKFRSSKGSIQYFLDNEVSAEKLANIPDLDADTIKASLDSVKEPELIPEPIKPVSIEFPREAVSMPSAPQLSQSDEQKVHYASLMRANLKLEGFEDSDIKAAVDVAFNASLGEKTEDMKQWSGGFRYNLSKALGLENLASNNDEYKVWASSIYDCSEKSIETCTLSKPSVELSEQVSAYTSVVNKKNLKAELASMSATETLNPETYFKDRQVQKRLIAKAEKNAERDTRKAERSVRRQENKAAMKEWFNRNFNSMLD